MIKTNEAHDIDRLLGQKIRELRIKEGITQKELAGDKITRNMLSLIENGSASPSVRTLLYIADKLETPAGYFFSSNSEDESRFLKLTVIENIKEKFRQKKYRECQTICSELPSDAVDDEISLILAASYMKTGIRAAEELDIASALTDFNSAVAYAAKSIYCGDEISRSAAFYRELIRSSTTDSISDLLCATSNICNFVPSSLVEYFIALRTVKAGAKSPFTFTRNSFYERHILILSTFAEEKVLDTQKKLRELSLDPALPYYMQYKVLCDLEKCADSTGDIRLAYSSSRRKLELIEKIRV